MSDRGKGALGVFVLGMHRSGTSAATRLLNLLGFSLGPDADLLPPQNDNSPGFWENEPLMRMNDRILEALDGAWDAPPLLEAEWPARPEVEALRPAATAILGSALTDARWAWKDPRNCLTLPFWLTDVRPPAAIVLMHRNPLEIAASLQARNGFAIPLGLALWERYIRSAFAAVRGRPVFITSYRRLIADPHAWAEAVAVFLRECGGDVPDPPRTEIESFVRPELWHAQFPDAALSEERSVSVQQHDLHAALEAAAGAHRSFSASELDPETPWVEALLAERRHARKQERERVAAEAARVDRTALVIVNRNGGNYLSRALAATERQTVSPHRVIVVDNGSTDGSVEGLEERNPGVEVVRAEANLGFAAANNLAARLADDCAYLALLNPDAFPEPGWLAALLTAAAQHADYSFFASRLLRERADRIDGTGDCIHVSGMVWTRDRDRPAIFDRRAGEVFAACAAAALYRRDAFVSVGGFDESFFCFHEDSDLSFRLQLAGHRCLYVPDAVVRHVGSALTGRLSDFTVYHSFRNQIWLWAKNMPLGLMVLYLPQHVLMNLLTLASFARRRRAGVVVRAQFDALRGLPQVIARRRETQARRRLGVLALRRALERGPGALVRESPSFRERRRRQR